MIGAVTSMRPIHEHEIQRARAIRTTDIGDLMASLVGLGVVSFLPAFIVYRIVARWAQESVPPEWWLVAAAIAWVVLACIVIGVFDVRAGGKKRNRAQ